MYSAVHRGRPLPSSEIANFPLRKRFRLELAPPLSDRQISFAPTKNSRLGAGDAGDDDARAVTHGDYGVLTLII